LDNDTPHHSASGKSAGEEEEARILLELCLSYDRMLAELTTSRTWRASRALSAVWAKLPVASQRYALRIGRRLWRSPLLASIQRAAENEQEIDSLRKQLYSRLIPGVFKPDLWTGNHPKVSVISSLYRSSASLPPFLTALRNQDYGGPIEVVLVDDMSPDGSGDAALALARDATDRLAVTVVRNAENLGNCGSRNRGIASATGEYIVVIDPDCIVNRSFVRAHVHHHLKGFNVVLGPMGIESGKDDAEELVERFERLGPTVIAPRMRLQDISAPASGVNCVTRNFSISRQMLDRLQRPLFDDRYAYRNAADTGFGWEDVEMGASLRRGGARIAFTWDAFSVHMSHGSAVDDRIRARGSAKNFVRLTDEHPELIEEAPDWAEITAGKIAKWQRGYEPENVRLAEIVKKARAARSGRQGANITVYTAVAGGYDRIRAPRKGLAARHVLYTDDRQKPSGWDVRGFDAVRPDSARTAKAPKVLAHRYLPDCEWSIWIDGNIELLGAAQSFVTEVERSGCPIGVFRHPKRHCAFEEAEVCIKHGKDAPEVIVAQLARYEAEGFPRRFGLAECNVIVRRHNDPAVRQAMEIWWDEIERGSRRDQLSFNYSLWRIGLPYHELSNGLADVRTDNRFAYHLHL